MIKIRLQIPPNLCQIVPQTQPICNPKVFSCTARFDPAEAALRYQGQKGEAAVG
ncbi:MAG: hypothetical protein ETSY2_53375 [Candidatus Entotheonella gemina]|uniref:Uncharacterized protein n=1 Tax=Candidatus Entotheonella gemina TaxID=1429439 RepID=W4L551_9BACT|nr:MAG: hypothetical protein ETSY2_53375 [Candidatus Entotheonella gemina]